MGKEKNYEKKFVGVLVIFMVCALVGCNHKNDENTVNNDVTEQNNDFNVSNVEKIGSKIDKDELFIASENINLQFYKNFTHIPYFKIDCLSSNEINTNEVKVFIDIDTPYKAYIEEVKDEEFDLYTFGLFTGYDWKKAGQLKEKNENEYSEYQKVFLNAYNEISENQIGELHHYIITINLDLDHASNTEMFHKIQIMYNQKKVDKDIGEIVIDCDEENPKKEKNLNATCLSMNDIYIEKNSQGYMELTNSNMYKAKKNVVLKYLFRTPYVKMKSGFPEIAFLIAS